MIYDVIHCKGYVVTYVNVCPPGGATPMPRPRCEGKASQAEASDDCDLFGATGGFWKKKGCLNREVRMGIGG